MSQQAPLESGEFQRWRLFDRDFAVWMWRAVEIQYITRGVQFQNYVLSPRFGTSERNLVEALTGSSIFLVHLHQLRTRTICLDWPPVDDRPKSADNSASAVTTANGTVVATTGLAYLLLRLLLTAICTGWLGHGRVFICWDFVFTFNVIRWELRSQVRVAKWWRANTLRRNSMQRNFASWR